VKCLEKYTELDFGCGFYINTVKKRPMSQNLPGCERFISGIEFETDIGNEE